MNVIKFIKSFNTVGFYLALSCILLAAFIIYFYVINPV
ncbi:hypothetical protein [Acinetobacter dispersus]|uniref:Uncharacterized protein n=1 Tax=Acinetobacter dispersus TaxID=70348 RepID=N9LM41_9GAMM|nr:hypothetical protein F904_00175 [Acinetobacter dispersus]